MKKKKKEDKPSFLGNASYASSRYCFTDYLIGQRGACASNPFRD